MPFHPPSAFVRARRAAAAAARAAALLACTLAASTAAAQGIGRVTTDAPQADALSAQDAKEAEAVSEAASVAKLLRTGDAYGALQRADEILKRQPRNVQVRFMRALALVDGGRRDEARGEYERLISDFPELPEPYNNLAVLQAADGHLKLAEETLQRALAAQPGYATARENLGDVYVALAAQSYQDALRADPASASAQAKLTLAKDAGNRIRAVH